LNSAATGAAFGASVGSIIPGVGTAIGGIVGGFAGLVGGLFGSSSRKDRLRRKMIAAQQAIDRTNVYNAAGAHSNYLG
jgi:phage tail tape-measure protein